MPSKKKKYNARFPAGRIKKIMQTDEEVGKVAQAVPVIISRTLELFVESLLTKSAQITQTRNAKTLTPSHMKQCILSESRFDFLKDLVKNIPDASVQEDNENNAIYEANLVQMNESDIGSDGGVMQNDTKQQQQPSTIEIVNKPIIAAANFYTEQQSTSTSRTPVILYGPKVAINRQTSESSSPPAKRSNLTVNNSVKTHRDEPQTTIQIATTIGSSSSTIVPVPPLIPTKNNSSSTEIRTNLPMCNETTPPPLIPISHNNSFAQNTDDSLCIDEDYDN